MKNLDCFAAVALIEDPQGRILSVWNRRYDGWGLPGGKGELAELPIFTLARELREETSLEAKSAVLIYSAKSCTSDRIVYVYSVVAAGVAKQVEPNSPVMWLTKDFLLATSPFRSFYSEMFAAIDTRTTTIAQ